MTIRGIAFPFTKSSTSLPAKSTDEDTVDDNIRRILLTPVRSRVMRPRAGSRVFNFLFESTGAVLRARVDEEVRRAISDGEPRARILRVSVREEGRNDGSTRVRIDVSYNVNANIRSTTVFFNRRAAQ